MPITGIVVEGGVSFGVGQADEGEAASAVECDELGEHARVEGADVHEKDERDLAAVDLLGELAGVDLDGLAPRPRDRGREAA